ncbi:MAG TPA: hypothetical protein VJV04_07310 [Nitrospiraceae bacterium]|nr:hypothetical protein [Nitrospiraceae bacterium]
MGSNAVADGLPDILGIQLGMPVRDAHAKLQAQLPKSKVQVQSTKLTTIDKPVITAFSGTTAEPIMIGMEGDQMTVDVTLPPNKQAVWRITRQHYFANKGIPKTTLLASLREKYGKEPLTNVSQNKPALDDAQINTLFLLFDEQGRPAPIPPKPEKDTSGLANALISACITLGDNVQLGLIEVYSNLYKGKNPQEDWCYNFYTAVFVRVAQSPDVPELYSQMRLVAVSLPYALSASEATMKWKKDIAEGQHKQDIEKAKQQEKPKL